MSPIKMDDPNTSSVDNCQYDIQEFTLAKEMIAPDKIAETIIKDDNNLEEIKILDDSLIISSPKKQTSELKKPIKDVKQQIIFTP